MKHVLVGVLLAVIVPGVTACGDRAVAVVDPLEDAPNESASNEPAAPARSTALFEGMLAKALVDARLEISSSNDETPFGDFKTCVMVANTKPVDGRLRSLQFFSPTVETFRTK